MDKMKEAELRIMLKREGKTHEEINHIVKQWGISEEKEELNRMIAEAENESIQVTEEPKTGIEESLAKIDSEATEKKQRVIQEQQLLDEDRDFNDGIRTKKMGILDRIESEVNTKIETLDAEIAEVETEKAELKRLYEKAQIEFVNDRIQQREKYKSELETFFGRIFDTITNFSDSPTELSLICLFTRSGTVVTLNGVLSSKRIIVKDEIKLGD